MTVRVEVVTPCVGCGGLHPGSTRGYCDGPGGSSRSFTEWPPEAIEAAAEAIYYAELPTSSFDKMGRTVPFGESMSPDQFREAAAQVVAALWDHITGKDET